MKNENVISIESTPSVDLDIANEKTSNEIITMNSDSRVDSLDSFDEEEAARYADRSSSSDSARDNVSQSPTGARESSNATGGIVKHNVTERNASSVGAKRNVMKSCYTRAWTRWSKFYQANSFLFLILCAILLAYAYPPLGSVYLAPEITATWIAVMFIFIMAGLGLKTDEFSKALQRLYFNSFVHFFNFGVISAGTYGFSRFLVAVGALTQSLADGMVICACLPLTVNMVMVLTKSAGGDEAAAVFNAAFGNMIGVILSPALILGYLGVKGEISLGDVFYKLGLRVVLPICIGQILQKFSKMAIAFVKKYKKHFKTVQEYCLVFIVYTVFCKTFEEGSDAGAGDIFIMIGLQLFLLCFFMVVAWFALKLLFRNQPKLWAMGIFGCTQKTVAMGVPLINAIYENDPLVGFYTLPLLVWHPMQLVLGSALAPRLASLVETEEKRLNDNKGNASRDLPGGDEEIETMQSSSTHG